jgi:hypothetical protein
VLDSSGELQFNGIDATTGDYAMPPLPVDEVARLASGDRLDADQIPALRRRHVASTVETLGAIEGVDHQELAEAGWAVIFAHDADPAIREALRPLLDRRRSEASTVKSARYRELAGADGYRPGESASQFLVRHGSAPGAPANPDVLPYYLLIVGGPEQIPFRIQYQLDVTYAVGRIDFDTPEEYARYAEAVIAAETAAPRPCEAAFFGPHNADDVATALSVEHLVGPLAAAISSEGPQGWTYSTRIGPEATKANLVALLTRPEPPALLFTAGHGMVFPSGDPKQFPHQGGLLCQDWPGRVAWRKAVPPDFYVSEDDLPATAAPGGAIAFLFACYGAGTPRDDDYVQDAGAPVQIAPEAFVARLPRRLLGHPTSPALAVVGHVERAMSYSFVWPGAGEQLDVFKSALLGLLHGKRLGWALEYFSDRFAALSTTLDDARETAKWGGQADPREIAGLWTAKNDARNYVILGDPAVRLRSPIVS